MNTLTPDATIESLKIGESNALIAVVVFVGPEKFGEISHGLLQNALGAGLRRQDVDSVVTQHFYSEHFSLRLLIVEWDKRGQAIAAIKEALTELEFLEHAIIALSNADKVWNVMHGNDRLWSCVSWVFLYNRDFKSALAEHIRERNARLVEWSKTGHAAYLQDLQQRAAKEQRENPHPNE